MFNCKIVIKFDQCEISENVRIWFLSFANKYFRQRLDPISKNILRRQNPLELVFEDISTFDAENPIAGSLLREIDIKKPSQIVILLNRCQAILEKNLKLKKD